MLSRRWYAFVIVVAVAALALALAGLLRSPGDRRADADRWGTGELIETDGVPVVTDAGLEASTTNDEVMERRLVTVPTVHESVSQVLVEVTAAEPFATSEGTGCGQRGPRGDDVVGVLPVYVTSIELSRPLGDRRVLDAARARQLLVVTD